MDTLTIGCSSGLHITYRLPITAFQPLTSSDTLLRLSIRHCLSGHSGFDIHLGRASATKLVGRCLGAILASEDEGTTLNDHPLNLQLASVDAVHKLNVIPPSASVTFAVRASAVESVREIVKKEMEGILAEYADVETEMAWSLDEIDPSSYSSSPPSLIPPSTTSTIITAITSAPFGVIKMSHRFPDTPELTCNLNALSLLSEDSVTHAAHTHSSFLHSFPADPHTPHSFEISLYFRSISETFAASFHRDLDAMYSLLGFLPQLPQHPHPVWLSPTNTHLLHVSQLAYQNIFKKEAKLSIVAAGFEPAVFCKIYPNIEMIAVGPTIHYPHTTQEALVLNTVLPYYKLVIEILKLLL